MNYDQIQAGQRVIVADRRNATGTVENKFRSLSDSPYPDAAPAGTEYVSIKFDGAGYAYNYPHQVEQL